jgi:hypothetical protein
VLGHEHPPGAPEALRNLVEDEEGAVAVAGSATAVLAESSARRLEEGLDVTLAAGPRQGELGGHGVEKDAAAEPAPRERPGAPALRADRRAVAYAKLDPRAAWRRTASTPGNTAAERRAS